LVELSNEKGQEESGQASIVDDPLWSRVEVSAGRKLEPANANFNRKVMDFAVETTKRSGNVLNSFCPAAAIPQRWDQMQS
jgi:hypothetical protein